MTRSKPTALAIGSAKDRKPPETSRQLAPPARIVWTSVSAPAVISTRSSRQRLSARSSSPASSRTRSRSAAWKIELALHRPLGDPRDLVLEAGIIGELVDAFLADDGRIHVGDEQPLPARLLRLDDDVDALEAVERPARGLRFAGEAQVRRIALVDPAAETPPSGSSSRSKPSARSINLSSSRPAAISVAIPMPSPKPPLVVIAGPTASGKSALALALAQQIGGVIVNADSAQIYRDLRVLSAAPTRRRAASGRAPALRHPGRRPALLRGRLGRAGASARSPISTQSGRTPILVGGTGLYLRTLLDGIAPVPAIDPEVRAGVRERAVEENRAKLETLDPAAAARLNPPTRRGSTARLRSSCRPAERWRSGRSSAQGGIGGDVELRPLILLPPRNWLYARCDERFAAHDRRGRGERSRGAARPQAQPQPAGDAGDRRSRALGLSARAKPRSTRRSPRASRRRAATPSANTPGSRTSRPPTGRAFGSARPRAAWRSAGPAGPSG